MADTKPMFANPATQTPLPGTVKAPVITSGKCPTCGRDIANT